MMNKKFYLIPISDISVKFKDNTLLDLLSKIDYELYEREQEKIEYISCTPVQDFFKQRERDLYEAYIANTKVIYNSKNLPTNIIVIGNSDEAIELITREKIDISSSSNMEMKEKTKEEICKYLDRNDLYEQQVKNYFNIIHKKLFYKKNQIVDFEYAKNYIKENK